MSLLTIDDLIGGADRIVEMEIPNRGTIRIRPLTSEEYTQVKTRKLKGFTVRAGGRDTGLSMDLGKSTENDFEGDALAISFGMVDPKMSIEQAKKMKNAGEMELIVKRIYEISGVTEDVIKAIENFRQQL